MDASKSSGRKNSCTQLLDELEELSQPQIQTRSARRTNSLVLTRNSSPSLSSVDETKPEENPTSNSKPLLKRLLLPGWLSKSKPDDENQQKLKKQDTKLFETEALIEKKAIWNWKPIRALSHIGMQKLSCLLSTEVISVQGLPASLDGLRLSVCIRKKETKEGAVHTMPSTVSQGAADFDETVFVKCHVYCTPGQGKELKFEPRPFWIYAYAVDSEDLNFGRGAVDLSQLIQESVEKSQEGTRIHQWDTSFVLLGKAKGGELVVKLGFQIMDTEGGIDIYSQGDEFKSGKSRNFGSLGLKQLKTSFSVLNPRITNQAGPFTPAVPTLSAAAANFQGMNELNLNEPPAVPALPPAVEKLKEPEAENKTVEQEVPDSDVAEKGAEVEGEKQTAGYENAEEKIEANSVVKEIIDGPPEVTKLTELDFTSLPMEGVESHMGEGKTVRARLVYGIAVPRNGEKNEGKGDDYRRVLMVGWNANF